jgi:AI-2 transport protein TqsA
MTDRLAVRLEVPRALRALLLAACFVIVTAGLRAAASWLVPLALALFVAAVSLPALKAFRRQGIPGGIAVLLVLLVDSAVLIILGMIVVRSAAEVRDALPEYVARFQAMEGDILAALERWGVEVDALTYGELVQPERVLGVATTLLRSLTEAFSAFVLLLLFLIFILIEAARLPDKLRAAFGGAHFDQANLGRILGEVQGYLAVKTVVSLVTGLLVGSAAALLGVDFALLWGLIAFVLNFVPSVGSIVAGIPAVLVALVQLGPGTALALAAAYLVVNMGLGNLLEPAIMGRRLGLSTFFVILSVVYWGFVWGPVGMLLSLPLTLSVKIALEQSSELRWLAILMGPGVPAQSRPPGPTPSVPPALASGSPSPAGGSGTEHGG